MPDVRFGAGEPEGVADDLLGFFFAFAFDFGGPVLSCRRDLLFRASRCFAASKRRALPDVRFGSGEPEGVADDNFRFFFAFAFDFGGPVLSRLLI